MLGRGGVGEVQVRNSCSTPSRWFTAQVVSSTFAGDGNCAYHILIVPMSTCANLYCINF